jgi:GT2 family glycosyltransferase
MPRVLLGIASAGSPARPFIDSLAALRLPGGVETLERSLAFGNFVPAQRELIAADAVDGGYDYLFFLDDDIVFPPETLASLLETIERDPATAVVGGLYYSRDSIRPMAVIDWNGDDTTTAAIPPFDSSSTGLVDGIGFGCALLRVSALRALTPPYFPVHIFIDRSARRVRLCDEDYRYCERIRRAGLRVRLDARVRCTHYDRESDTVAPVRWEPDVETNVRRMIVAEDGLQKLVPFDDRVPRASETHVRADVVYLTVD